MAKIIYHIRKSLIPSFTYKFSSSLPDDSYIGGVKRLLSSQGRTCTQSEYGSISFYMKASEIFGRPSPYGILSITVWKVGNGEHKFTIKFTTYRALFFVGAITLSVIIFVSAFMTGNLIRIISLPFVFLSGHLFFWGIIPAKAPRLKERLLYLA
jgi:hypothetical protein